MKFLDYKVLKATYSLTPDIQPNKNYKIMPKINCNIRRGSDKILCTFNVDLTKKDEPIPFEFSISAVGTFEVDGKEDVNTLTVKVAETVFPFVRASIAGLTQMANIPAFVLPFVDMEELLKNAREEKIAPPISTTLN